MTDNPTRQTHPRQVDKHVKVDLHNDGVLFMINALVFHPRGYGLAYNPVNGSFILLGDGHERWRFAEDADAAGETADNDSKWAAFNALLERAKTS